MLMTLTTIIIIMHATFLLLFIYTLSILSHIYLYYTYIDFKFDNECIILAQWVLVKKSTRENIEEKNTDWTEGRAIVEYGVGYYHNNWLDFVRLIEYSSCIFTHLYGLYQLFAYF